MSVLVVGLSHRTAPVSLLERVAISGDALVKLLQDVSTAEPVAEALLLSTCNRVELYADVDRFHGGVADLSGLLARHTGVAIDELTPHLYVHYEERAVHHLFSVACGLDSMVIGEGQILGQLKSSLALAQESGSAGRVLNELAQQALRVGKRAHSETDIDRAGQSLVTVALEQADAAGADVGGSRTLVVGAGSMSALAATTLQRQGAGNIVVTNRTYERAEHLADQVGGRAVPISALPEALAAADLVISCTGATGLVISAADIEAVVASRGERAVDRPLVLIDLALPRDIDPAVRGLDGVHLIDLELLADAGTGAAGTADVDVVRRLVGDEVAEFATAQRALTVTPTVVALRAMAADVVRSELERLAGRTPDLDAKERGEVEQTVRRIVDKLLHAPTVRVKQLASEPGGASYAEALRTLFDLGQGPMAAVSRADLGAAGTAAPDARVDVGQVLDADVTRDTGAPSGVGGRNGRSGVGGRNGRSEGGAA
ncbi:glutamyl-tRNA reductase [Yinghuangia sp. ASG 101]|uniref:glutamyl-tRNA reductase n=1 Tax=Yinghuangia sp. ASG 101 TaxID=2896848 RepID=UPI001E2F94B0|nr:glutamyl-tRNA reductase [Yinghuangia sp. ASG 101]UGQ09224.1 glutamyl-tRNA reductase [Yinghuangia sp. ASG 101]